MLIFSEEKICTVDVHKDNGDYSDKWPDLSALLPRYLLFDDGIHVMQNDGQPHERDDTCASQEEEGLLFIRA